MYSPCCGNELLILKCPLADPILANKSIKMNIASGKASVSLSQCNACRYGGGEGMQPVSPARRSVSSVPAPAPGRSLSLHPLAVLAPVPAPVKPATPEPNQAPNAHSPSVSQTAPATRGPIHAALTYAPSPAGRSCSQNHHGLHPMIKDHRCEILKSRLHSGRNHFFYGPLYPNPTPSPELY